MDLENLAVLGLCFILQSSVSEAPSNVQIDVSAPLLEGQEVFMKCSSEGHPSPDISWNRINLPWPSNLQRHSNGTVTGLLSPENSGLYECIANNTMGQNRKPISLAVEYGPRYTSIHASETSIRTRELLNLTCVTDSYPAVQQYKWKKLPAQAVPKDVTQKNSYLIINSFQKHHEGIYECEVVHQSGRTERVYFNAILKEPEEQTGSQSSPLPGAVAGSLLVGMTGGGLAGFLLAKRLL
nr:PREDICTED: intercellular adhesion molecule 5-like isoform X2 [Lepisosteus oculatus]